VQVIVLRTMQRILQRILQRTVHRPGKAERGLRVGRRPLVGGLRHGLAGLGELVR
jgi:hypothetical protein